MTTPQQNESFVRNLVMACITGCIPFTFVENPYLKEAAKVIGVTLPSRKQLSTTVLDNAFKDIKTADADLLAKLRYFDASSDGWRKKYCEQGVSLTNFCALTANGTLLHDVLNCSAVRKDADGIADMLIDAAEKMTGGECSRVAGWILDNTKANWAAMKKLAAEHPDWIMRGCIAHGLALSMKDFTKFTAGRGRTAKQDTWGCKWAETTLAAANKIANFINDSPATKQQVWFCAEARCALLRCAEDAVLRWCINTRCFDMKLCAGGTPRSGLCATMAEVVPQLASLRSRCCARDCSCMH